MQVSLLMMYALSVAMLVMTPGPVVALIVDTRIHSGSKRALWTLLGTNGASLVLAGLAVLVLAGTLSLDARLLDWISLGGCVFIGYLGIKGLQGLHRGHGDNTRTAAESGRRGGVLNGFLMGISNPKDIVFFVSFFPQFIHISPSFSQSVAVLIAVWVVIDFSILAFYIYLAGRSCERHRAMLTLISNTVLLLVALAGSYYSIRALLSPAS